MKKLHFYFDYLSPYAYFAWLDVRDVAKRQNAELVLHPVLFAGLLSHHGHKGPAEIPSKRKWVIHDALRIANRRGIGVNFPAQHPFRPLSALRMSLSGPDQVTRIDAIWRAGWQDGRDLSDPDVLESALSDAGVDGAMWRAKTQDPEVKAELRKETEDAIALGVFGVPTMIVNDVLFWGSDRMADVEAALSGNDPLDHDKAATLLAVPYGVKRIP